MKLNEVGEEGEKGKGKKLIKAGEEVAQSRGRG